MKKLAIVFLFPLAATAQDLLDYVNPLIGTAKMGHTFPGASVPFGMVQLSPDTDTIPYEVNGKYNGKVYEYCSGYQYKDSTLVGFSHTHFSGTGHSDLGDVLLMPYSGKTQFHPGVASDPQNGYRSAFKHQNEIAKPNYYKVLLEDEKILAELTTTERVGMHRYTFNQAENNHVILDLKHGIYPYEGKNVWTFVRVENDTLLTGYRQTNGWGRTRTVYFAIAFSEPIANYVSKKKDVAGAYRGFWRKFDEKNNFPELAGYDIQMNFDFNIPANKQLLVKVALSPTSTRAAILNMASECPSWNFDEVLISGQDKWRKEMNKFKMETILPGDKISLYTALYHTCLGPTIYSDVDGSYKGLDQNIHQAKDFQNYGTFSLWDTYRSLHPWFNLTQTQRNNDMVKSMLAHQEQSVHGLLPIWSHHANENWCMIGYHAVSVIADAALNPLSNFDKNAALDACVQTATREYLDGLGAYMKYKYVPEDKSGSSVSKTLEYAYDDYAISRLASHLNQSEISKQFEERSKYYVNVYDSMLGFMRPKMSDGTFLQDFDVLNTHQRGYIEGNSWNYSLYVPHQPQHLIQMMGGKTRFVQHLDSLFTMSLPDKYFEKTEDISRDGIIGNYVHGNEPSHHVIYLFNEAGAPHLTQKYARKVMREMYRPKVDGLGGNDDCGQMSAWYLFSSLGIYPMAPGSGLYSLGSPQVVQADVVLGNGKELKIRTSKQSEKNVYVKSVSWNGTRLKEASISFDELWQGGTLLFEMTNKPVETFKTSKSK